MPVATQGADLSVNPLPQTKDDQPAIQAQVGTSSYEVLRTPNVFKDIVAASITAGTPATVWTPAAGKKFRLMGWHLSNTVASSFIFKHGAGPTTMFRTPAGAGSALVAAPPGIGNGFLCPTADDVLKLDVTATGIVSGFVFGCEE